jgi:hypothetical protein
MQQFELDLAASADKSPVFGRRRVVPGGVFNPQIAEDPGVGHFEQTRSAVSLRTLQPHV